MDANTCRYLLDTKNLKRDFFDLLVFYGASSGNVKLVNIGKKRGVLDFAEHCVLSKWCLNHTKYYNEIAQFCMEIGIITLNYAHHMW
jgi:hypothetical protein